MSRRLFPISLAIGLAWAGAALAQTPPAPPRAAAAGTGASFETFQLIGNLNIFNASRVGWTPGSVQPHVDTIAFVGTMESAKGRLAFFNSSNRSFRLTLPQGGSIAGFTVSRIDTSGVELTKDAKPFTLGMGQQLRRPPGGDWALGPAGAYEAASAAATSAAPEIPAGASDVLKRLMEKRQQELKQ
jgi:hypothetical protein